MKIKINKYSKHRICLMFFILLFGCVTDPGDEFINSFKQTPTIELQSIPIKLKQDTPFLSYMFEMIYSDSLLFINEFPDPEYCMKIVDLRHNTIRNFAKKGKGPFEMQSQACDFSVDYLNRNLYVTDHSFYSIYSIDSLLCYKDNPQSRFSIRPQEGSFLRTTYCNGYVIGSGIKNRFALLNIKTKEYKGKYQYPTGLLVDQANFYSHPRKNIVAYFNLKSATMGLLHILNDTMTMKEHSWWKSKNKEIINGQGSRIIPGKDEKNGFITTTVSEKYIYTLYSGKNLDRRSIEKLTNAFVSQYIYVLDWEGIPVKRFKLDQEVRAITIDDRNNTIYAGSNEGGEPHIIKYQLK